jgi:hypothetical protein
MLNETNYLAADLFKVKLCLLAEMMALFLSMF